MPEKDPLLERQQLHADSLEGDDKADGGLYTMGQTNVQRGILQGKRILVTRTREQAGVLSERLLALGAMPVEFPTIGIHSIGRSGDFSQLLWRMMTSVIVPMRGLSLPARMVCISVANACSNEGMTCRPCARCAWPRLARLQLPR